MLNWLIRCCLVGLLVLSQCALNISGWFYSVELNRKQMTSTASFTLALNRRSQVNLTGRRKVKLKYLNRAQLQFCSEFFLTPPFLHTHCLITSSNYIRDMKSTWRNAFSSSLLPLIFLSQGKNLPNVISFRIQVLKYHCVCISCRSSLITLRDE